MRLGGGPTHIRTPLILGSVGSNSENPVENQRNDFSNRLWGGTGTAGGSSENNEWSENTRKCKQNFVYH